MGYLSFYSKNLLEVTSLWWWVIVPFFTHPLLKSFWTYSIKADHFIRDKYAVLKIKVPRELEKSPLLMENVLHGLWTVCGSPRNFMETWTQGIVQDYFSLEIVGAEGKVYFGLWVLEDRVDFFKSHIYAQYPEAEIEVSKEDYADLLPEDAPSKEWDLWGTIWTLAKNDAFPIKTYSDFEDSITGTMVDPIASFMEVLGDLGPGEHIWYQLLVEPIGNEWQKEFGQEVEKILDRGKYKEKITITDQIKKDFSSFPQEVVSGMFKPYESAEASKEDKTFTILRLSPGEQENLKTIERNLSKRGFKVQYRTAYFAKKENYRGHNIPSMMGAINQFNSVDLNGLNIYKQYMTSCTYFFEKVRVAYKKRRLLRVMKKRQYSGLPYIMSTEEVASLWHFPDMAVKSAQTPRVASKKVSAPSNIPGAEN
jgi:hypothetical protein